MVGTQQKNEELSASFKVICIQKICRQIQHENLPRKKKKYGHSQEPTSCKLCINDKTIEQVMNFKYLDIELSGYIIICIEVFNQTCR